MSMVPTIQHSWQHWTQFRIQISTERRCILIHTVCYRLFFWRPMEYSCRPTPREECSDLLTREASTNSYARNRCLQAFL